MEVMEDVQRQLLHLWLQRKVSGRVWVGWEGMSEPNNCAGSSLQPKRKAGGMGRCDWWSNVRGCGVAHLHMWDTEAGEVKGEDQWNSILVLSAGRESDALLVPNVSTQLPKSWVSSVGTYLNLPASPSPVFLLRGLSTHIHLSHFQYQISTCTTHWLKWFLLNSLMVILFYSLRVCSSLQWQVWPWICNRIEKESL